MTKVFKVNSILRMYKIPYKAKSKSVFANLVENISTMSEYATQCHVLRRLYREY